MKDFNSSQVFKKYEPFIEGIVELFYPFVEAVIHHVKNGEIVAIFNNISKRKVGESSPLQELKIKTESFPDFFPPYYKKN